MMRCGDIGGLLSTINVIGALRRADEIRVISQTTTICTLRHNTLHVAVSVKNAIPPEIIMTMRQDIGPRLAWVSMKDRL